MRCVKAARRKVKLSAMAWPPSVVLKINAMAPLVIASTMCGRPSRTLFTVSTAMPWAFRWFAVPDVAAIAKPSSDSSLASPAAAGPTA